MQRLVWNLLSWSQDRWLDVCSYAVHIIVKLTLWLRLRWASRRANITFATVDVNGEVVLTELVALFYVFANVQSTSRLRYWIHCYTGYDARHMRLYFTLKNRRHIAKVDLVECVETTTHTELDSVELSHLATVVSAGQLTKKRYVD